MKTRTVLGFSRRPLVLPLFVAASLAACSAPDAARSDRVDRGSEPAVPLPEGPVWFDVTEQLLDSTGSWTNKVELADLDGDGRLDLLFANGGDYSTPGEPELNGAFLNRGEAGFEDVSDVIFGTRDLTRVIKARDFDGDGRVDVFVGNTYQTPSRIFFASEDGGFAERSASHLPRRPLSLGDAEPGDVDGDGDLDLLLADWGPGNNMTNEGGVTRIWLNDGAGRFSDATDERMPAQRVGFSWDVELVDVDNDLDLDGLISCKRCPGSVLLRNDGSGRFAEDRRGLPQYTNNYEFEAMDLDGDGFLDLVTINDGDIVGGIGSSRREHVFRNDGEGRYRDATDDWWPDAENIGEDDNVVAYLDYDSDGDADFLIGSLSGPDRLMVNDGRGGLRAATDVFSGADTPGTLGMAIGDVDGDGRIDVVQSQGEHPTAIQERIFSGRGLASDTRAPVITLVTITPQAGERLVRARVHDRKSPTLPTEWRSVEVRYRLMDATISGQMSWYGEYLWRAAIPADAHDVEVCATDASGNAACSSPGEAR
ncbi:MAG: VCBS repeat-containing protein [Gemmatimonadota bacterium]|nr:VCBS repeat-containing protein [Gemmatimonadota bacterium]